MYEMFKKTILYVVLGALLMLCIVLGGIAIRKDRLLADSVRLVEQYRSRELEAKNASVELGKTISAISGGLDRQATSIGELRSLMQEMEEYYNNLWCEYQRLDGLLGGNDCNASKE